MENLKSGYIANEKNFFAVQNKYNYNPYGINKPPYVDVSINNNNYNNNNNNCNTIQ